jgi:glycosyltransferase involved in cell wall biosynthesis
MKSTDCQKNKLNITIGIPSYCGSRTLARTVSNVALSLRRIDCRGREIIICVNGGDEKTNRVAFALEKQESDLIRVLTLNEANKSNAMNEIFIYSTGDVLFFIDDDVWLDKDCLDNLYHGLVESNTLQFVWANLKLLGIRDPNPFRNFVYLVLNLRYREDIYKIHWDYAHGSCMGMYRLNYPGLPEGLINDDQYLHIHFWGKAQQIEEAKCGVFGVSSIGQYLARQFRLKTGHIQMSSFYSPDRLNLYNELLNRKLKLNQFRRMNIRNIILIAFAETLRWIAGIIYIYWGNRHWSWSRNSYDHHKTITDLYNG